MVIYLEQENVERPFLKVLEQVQSHISKEYSIVIGVEDDTSKEQLKNRIKKYLHDKKMRAEGLTEEETIEKIYLEMSSLSFLTAYLDLNRTDIEEVNINAWNDVEVFYSGGKREKLKEHFTSPEHCENIIRRLLNAESKMILDLSHPIVRGHLDSKVRLTIMGKGVIDDAVGVSASLRIVNPKNLKKEDFVANGTATNEMIEVIGSLFRYGCSMCITGETNSGKTTLMSYVLSQIPNHKRLFTIEEDVREFDLHKYDEEGRVINNVVHTRTKKSDNEKHSIDQDYLLESSLTMNPDFIAVAEMKGKESYAAQEAARTGHTVITTIHANSAEATWKRMVTLCQNNKNNKLDSKTLKELVQEAFPVVVQIKRMEDNVRRILEIIECVPKENGENEIITLYHFDVAENVEDEEGNIIEVKGSYIKKNPISEYTKKKLINNGIPRKILSKLLLMDQEVGRC